MHGTELAEFEVLAVRVWGFRGLGFRVCGFGLTLGFRVSLSV